MCLTGFILSLLRSRRCSRRGDPAVNGTYEALALVELRFR